MRWRKATWALVVFNVLMLVWVVAGIASSGGNATGCGSLDQQTCNVARNVGTGIGVSILFVLWFIGFMVLSLIWLMSRPHRRQCPACGNEAKRGSTSCRSCGHSFVPMPDGSPRVAATWTELTSPDHTQRWNGKAWVPIGAPTGPPPAPTSGR